MSSQSKAKAAQGYVAKAVPQTCMNCAHFTLDMVVTKSKWENFEREVEQNLRCSLGGFAVKKMGTCDEFVLGAQP